MLQANPLHNKLTVLCFLPNNTPYCMTMPLQQYRSSHSGFISKLRTVPEFHLSFSTSGTLKKSRLLRMQ